MRIRPVVLPAALFVAALVARLWLVDVRPYGDEVHHYYVAREFGRYPSNFVNGGPTEWLFWWRPLFSLLLSPGAQVSFTGFRVGYMLMTSLLPVAAVLYVRARGASEAAAGAAGAVLALHPFFVVWGVRAFPDELMAVPFLFGLWLWETRRPVAAALLFVAACWVKESAMVGVAVLLAESALRSAWPHLRAAGAPVARRLAAAARTLVAKPHLALAGALALAYLPHIYASSIGGRSPGWSRGGNAMGVVDGAFTTIWLVPAVAATLVARRSRSVALQALLYLAFYTLYTLAGGRAEGWYFLLPTALATLALALGVDALSNPRATSDRSVSQAASDNETSSAASLARRARRPAWAAPVAALALAGVVLVQVAAPSTSVLKLDVLHPTTHALDYSYQEMVDFEQQRDHALWEILDQMDETDRQGVLAVDLAWFFTVWPLSDVATTYGAGFTGGWAGDTAPWAAVIEEQANATLLHREPTPLNGAIVQVYADCVAAQNPEYVVIRGQMCKGRAQALQDTFNVRSAA